MTALALISGALFKEAETKIARASGKPFVVAKLKVAADNALDFWRIVAFSETAQAELLRLGEGDKLSAQGSLKLEIYSSKDGEQKLSRTLIADHVLALRPPPRARKPKVAPATAADGPAPGPREPAPFDDAIPWGGPEQ